MVSEELLKKVRLIEIQVKRIMNSQSAGAYISAFKGQGMEFSEVREYQPGDDIRTIDWNVTAKTGIIHTKKFIEERENIIILVVDVSASGNFGSLQESKREIIASIGALLAFSAVSNNDKVGLVLFSDIVEKYIPPSKGRKHVLRMVRELLSFKPQNQKTDLAVALEELNHSLNRRSVIFMISDFFTPPFSAPLKLLNQKHEIIGIDVSDQREQKLPPIGLIELQDPETKEIILLDTFDKTTRQQFQNKQTEYKKQIQHFFQKLGVDYTTVSIQENLIATLLPLVQLFIKRNKK